MVTMIKHTTLRACAKTATKKGLSKKDMNVLAKNAHGSQSCTNAHTLSAKLIKTRCAKIVAGNKASRETVL